ncbi:hypothetical protein IFR04_004560 [Cadophora malorum]|uniref:F-box domain-containing protein n=1 Tax=Cadophora malorum TaxID=108018 RepID=A0A8H7WCG7_9HELO|nr:hypothetical protein IFR04_004560 [Cadophora malorum]
MQSPAMEISIASPISPLERLPVLVLNRICEYIDDESASRQNLQAFSRTSRSLHTAADVRRYSQIELLIRDQDKLKGILKRWNEVLTDGRHRHVRRLKISWALDPNSALGKGRASESPDEELDEDGYRVGGFNVRPYFHMHNFCRPSEDSMRGNGGARLREHPEYWATLGEFVNQFPGLQDFIWAAGGQIPPSVIAAVFERKCRLHHHNFVLGSLVYDRNDVQPVSPKDYVLCTSPYLSSIVVRFGYFGGRGHIDYTQEAVMKVISGLAPNLVHLCVIQKQSSGERSDYQTWELGRPAWKGFFPGPTDTAADLTSGRGRLQSLVFAGYKPESIESWARLTDFSKLRCLLIKWEDHGPALAELASRGNLRSLQRLELISIKDETTQSQNALNILLSSLNPLERLQLSGCISPETFNIIVHHHGENLRNLSLVPEADEETRNPLIVFSGIVLQHLSSHSRLTHLSIPINRTRGDKNEVGLYRTLRILGRRERRPASTLRCGEAKIPSTYLKEAFSNGAMDETLARGIFNLISNEGRSTLRYLRLQLSRKSTRNAPGACPGDFGTMLRWFNRSFACTHDVYRVGDVMIKELGMAEVRHAEEHWKYMMEDEQARWNDHGEDLFVEVFGGLWPKQTEEWWKEWRSLPLDVGEGV